MIFNPYYPRNPPFIFSNTPRFAADPFSNMVSIGIIATKGSKGVQASMMPPPTTIPIGRFSTRNVVPYFQSPTKTHY
jgi:hypothetical protein